jgi:hypothetical protein
LVIDRFRRGHQLNRSVIILAGLQSWGLEKTDSKKKGDSQTLSPNAENKLRPRSFRLRKGREKTLRGGRKSLGVHNSVDSTF